MRHYPDIITQEVTIFGGAKQQHIHHSITAIYL